jgi:hypothetical protein
VRSLHTVEFVPLIVRELLCVATAPDVRVAKSTCVVLEEGPMLSVELCHELRVEEVLTNWHLDKKSIVPGLTSEKTSDKQDASERSRYLRFLKLHE